MHVPGESLQLPGWKKGGQEREGAGEEVPAMLGGKGSAAEMWKCRNLGAVGEV